MVGLPVISHTGLIGLVLTLASIFYIFIMPMMLSYGEDRMFMPHAIMIGLFGIACMSYAYTREVHMQ